jgi:hypothetical protein
MPGPYLICIQYKHMSGYERICIRYISVKKKVKKKNYRDGIDTMGYDLDRHGYIWGKILNFLKK